MNALFIGITVLCVVFIIGGLFIVRYANKVNEKMEEEAKKQKNK